MKYYLPSVYGWPVRVLTRGIVGVAYDAANHQLTVINVFVLRRKKEKPNLNRNHKHATKVTSSPIVKLSLQLC